MNSRNSFIYDGKAPLRVVWLDEVPWFVAKDVRGALELGDAGIQASLFWRLDADEKGMTSIPTLGAPGTNSIRTGSGGQRRQLLVVSESALYNLILGCHKPQPAGGRFAKQEFLLG